MLLLCTCAGFVRAQYDARLSHYFMARPYYNPAVAGATEDLNILSLARMEWVGVSGAPKSAFVTADMPFAIGKTQQVCSPICISGPSMPISINCSVG